MASVRKREWTHKGETKSAWVVEYTDQGGRRRMRTFEKKKDADAFRNQAAIEVQIGTHTVRSDSVTFAHAAMAWLDSCERRWRRNDRMAGNTFKNYRFATEKKIIPAIGRLMLSDIKVSAIQDHVDDLATRYKTTASLAVIVINQIFKFAIEREWIAVNPLKSRPLRARDSRQKKAVPTKEEIQRILAALAERGLKQRSVVHRNRIGLVTLGLFAGMRGGEICGLQWENVDFEKRALNIRHSLSTFDGLKGPRSKAGIRSIPMADPVYNVLQWLREIAGTDAVGYVLMGDAGRPVAPQRVMMLYTPVLKQAGLLTEDGKPRYTFHALRHAAVSVLIEGGLQPFHIMHIIGHSSIGVTMDVYVHLFPDDGSSRKAIHGAASKFDFGNSAPALLGRAAREATTILP